MIDRHAAIDSLFKRRSTTGYLLAGTLALLTLTNQPDHSTVWAISERSEVFRNMTYPSEWTRGGRAPLAGGVYEEPVALGSASTIVIRLTDLLAVGSIEGQSMAALVTVTDPGGSGVFVDLYLALQREHDWVIVDHTHLGDRIRVDRIEIEQGLVGLDLTVHGPHDGICCPTERRWIHYALQDGRLVKVDEPGQNPPGFH
jgi:hypothetical protein